MFPLEESSSSTSDNNRSCPELFIYGCKVNGSNIYTDHISEVTFLVSEPNDVFVSVISFSLLC